MFRHLIKLETSMSSSLPLFQIVRWKRKPRKPFWLGTAKSKIFYIPEEPKQHLEEYEGLKRLYRIYRTQTKSIGNFLSRNVETPGKTYSGLQLVSDSDIQTSLASNEEWNLECRRLREERLLQESKKHEEVALNIMESREITEKQSKELIETMIKAELDRAQHYITRDNIDQAIEDSLSQTVSFNYAIDLEGRIYEGSSTSATSQKEGKIEELLHRSTSNG